jgi:hypothetical protein
MERERKNELQSRNMNKERMERERKIGRTEKRTEKGRNKEQERQETTPDWRVIKGTVAWDFLVWVFSTISSLMVPSSNGNSSLIK